MKFSLCKSTELYSAGISCLLAPDGTDYLVTALYKLSHAIPALYKLSHAIPALYKLSHAIPALYKLSHAIPALYKLSHAIPALYKLSHAIPALYKLSHAIVNGVIGSSKQNRRSQSYSNSISCKTTSFDWIHNGNDKIP